MPPSDPPIQITLRVKVPPGYLPPSSASTDSEQFNIGTIPVSTTVGALRAQIQQLIPTHPAPERQRILYGGHALIDNDQTVGDALNIKRDPTQEDYVVHLLVKGEGGVSRTPTPNSMTGRSTAGHGSLAGGPPAQSNPTALQLEQSRRNLLEMQAQMMRQHNQHHTRALAAHGFPGFGQQPPTRAHGQPAPLANGAQSGAQHIPTQDAGNTGLPQPSQQMPPHQHTGQGFHVEGFGPDGQRFQVHQQMFNLPAMHMPAGMPGQHMIHPYMNPLGMGFPGMLPPPQVPERAANAPSALDQARENLLEMRRMLDELAAQAPGEPNEQDVQRLRDIQSRARSVNEYIDPLGLHNANANNGNTAAGTNGQNQAPQSRPAAPGTPNGMPAWPRNLRVIPPHMPGGFMMPPAPQQIHAPTRTLGDVTAYLLSSPQGPQALLFSPEHGAYTGVAPELPPTHTTSVGQPNDPLRPNALGQAANNPPVPPAAVGVPADPVAQAARQQLIDGVNAQAVQAANGEAEDPLGMQPILGHFWLLFRILVFAYFLLGSNMGWQRPIVLAGIGLGFWLVRMGVLGDGGMVRRWWEGVVGMQRQPQAPQGHQNGAAAAVPGQGDNVPGAQPANAAVNGRQAMPTPEEVAQRLLNEAEAQQRGWLREQLRPVERALALFVASLWPGIGEGYVREQRRQQEEAEAEARRRAEEEEARKREVEAQTRTAEKEAQTGTAEKEAQGEGSGLNTGTVEQTAPRDDASRGPNEKGN